MADQYVKLAEPDGGFYDDESRFQIARDQVKALPEKPGRKTMLAIQSGGLLIVEMPKSATGKKKDGDNKDS